MKKQFLLLITTCCCIYLLPPLGGMEGGCQTFQNTWGGIWADAAYDIAPTKDSNFIITGSTYNSSLSCNNILLMKIDTMGDTLWTHVYGTSGGQTGRSVTATSDSGFIVGVSAGGFIGNKGNDIIIFNTDAVGNLQWSKIYGGLYSDDPVEIIEMAGNGYIFFGHTLNYGYFDTTICKRGTGDYCPNILIMKINNSGDTLWTKVIYNSAGQWNIIYQVIRTRDGGFLMVGASGAFNTLGAALLIKIDSTGTIKWSKSYKPKFTEARGVLEKEDGNLIIMGHGWWDNSNWMNTQGIILAETDSAGNLKWVKITENGNDTTFCDEVGGKIEKIISSYIISGYSQNFRDSSCYGSNWGGGGLLIGLDTLFNIEWQKNYGGGGDDIRGGFASIENVVCATGVMGSYDKGNGDIYILLADSMGNSACLTYDMGLTMLAIDPATITEIDTGFVVGNTNTIVMDYPLEQGYPTLYMMDCDSFNTIEEPLSVGRLRLEVYPNPGSGVFALRLNGNVHRNITSVSIYTILGEEILTENKIKSSSLLLDMTSYPEGIYFIRATFGEEVFFGKIIMQR